MQKVLGGYSILAAAVIGVHFVAEPLYYSGSDGAPLWGPLNWIMALATLIAVGAAGRWKFFREESGDTGRGTGALFWTSVFLALWFFWNWFGTLMGRGMLEMWPFIDPLFVVVSGAVGLRLWRGTGASA